MSLLKIFKDALGLSEGGVIDKSSYYEFYRQDNYQVFVPEDHSYPATEGKVYKDDEFLQTIHIDLKRGFKDAIEKINQLDEELSWEEDEMATLNKVIIIFEDGSEYYCYTSQNYEEVKEIFKTEKVFEINTDMGVDLISLENVRELQYIAPNTGFAPPEPDWGEDIHSFIEKCIDVRERSIEDFKVTFNYTDFKVEEDDTAKSLYWKWKYHRDI